MQLQVGKQTQSALVWVKLLSIVKINMYVRDLNHKPCIVFGRLNLFVLSNMNAKKVNTVTNSWKIMIAKIEIEK